MPKSYSAIITTFNRPSLVVQAIQSVLEQSRPAEQIIVVIDCNDFELSAKLKLSFPGILVETQPNFGVAVARNTGIALADSDYVAFLDDDDLWHREKLAEVDLYLEANLDCEAVNHPVWWFAEENEGPERAYGFSRDFVAQDLRECHEKVLAGDPSSNSYDYLKIRGESFSKLLENNRGALSGTVIKRERLIEAGGFSPMHSPIEDWTMFMNAARVCEWHTISRRLAFCRLHRNQITFQSANGVYAIGGLINAWLTGRPAPERIKSSAVLDRLATCGPTYRKMVQEYLWGAIRRGDWTTASLTSKLGGLILPRRRDRMYTLVPPQITWRFERYILGMHK
jgi:glycosyltransferase involved in cell wall biosynthesis